MCKKVIPLLLGVSILFTASAVDMEGKIGIGAEPPKISLRYWVMPMFALDAQVAVHNLIAPEGTDMAIDLGFDLIVPLFKDENMNFSGIAGADIINLTEDAREFRIPVGLEAEFFFSDFPKLGFKIAAGLAAVSMNGDMMVHLGISPQLSGLGFHYYFP